MTERKRRHRITEKQIKVCRHIAMVHKVYGNGVTTREIASALYGFPTKIDGKVLNNVRGILHRLVGYGWIRSYGRLWIPTTECHIQLRLWDEEK